MHLRAALTVAALRVPRIVTLGSFIALAALPTVARADASDSSPATTVYQGTIGKYSIVMELPTAPTPSNDDGKYFYTSHRVDIDLVGEVLKQGGLSLEEQDSNNYFQIAPAPNGHWKGFWSNSKGKRLPVELRPAKLPPLPNGAPSELAEARTHDPYFYLRLVDISLQHGNCQTFMGYQLEWVTDPGSSISTFQVLSGYPVAQRQRINQRLMSQFWGDVDSFYECSGDAMDDYEVAVTPTFMSPAVVSASESVDADCGGAHPSHEHAPINIDAVTGKWLDITDVLTPSAGAADSHAPLPHAAALATLSGSKASAAGTVLAHWLVAQFKVLYPKPMRVTDPNSDDCNYGSPDVWDPVYWHFTPKGVFVMPDGFAYVEMGCREGETWSVIPYSVIKQHPGKVKLALP